MKENGVNKGEFNSDDVATKQVKGDSIAGKWIPPHIAWPLFVVGLLVLGVSWSLWVVFASSSDGGAQVVENYYEKAIEWDDRNQVLLDSQSAGWDVDLNFVPADTPGFSGNIEITFLDKEGQPITELKGSVKAYRPQITRALSEMKLSAHADKPGVYYQAFPAARNGLWDFEIEATQDSFRFLKKIRKELVF